MTPAAYFLVNVDTDPDPEDTPRDDAAVLAKYRVMKTLIDGRADGKAALCVQTSPLYRDRFIEEPFLGFFRDWAAEGADLVLHPEEDLYGTPETRLASGTRYADTDYMAGIIADRMQCIAERGLAFAANRGGYHGFTKGIAGLLRRAGIGIDLTCAPGIEWPEKVAPWGAAPLSAYYMAADDPARPAAPDAADALFEIPSGWDGAASDTSARHLLNEHYLVNEFSTFEAMARVWDAIVARAEAAGRPEIVSLLCHTYTMADAPFRERLAAILDYMRANAGAPVTAAEAKALYDAGGTAAP